MTTLGVDLEKTLERGELVFVVIPDVAAPTDATTDAKGILQLAGDLAGTADAPTVPGLATLADQIAALGGGSQPRALRPNVFQYALPLARSTAAATVAFAGGQIYGTPILIEEGFTADMLGARCTTAETGAELQILLYASNELNFPGVLVASAVGAATSTGARALSITGGPVVLEPGIYWAYVRQRGGTGAARFLGCSPMLLQSVGTTTVGATPSHSLWLFEPDLGTFEAPAAVAPAASGSDPGPNYAPWVGIRRSA